MEYEYSFKVKSFEPYIDYCVKNGYELVSDTTQDGRVFILNNTLARVRINTTKNGETKKVLDFKDADDSKNVLKVRRETKALEFDDYEAVQSILDYFGYVPEGNYIRERKVYQKNGVIFEMDYYLESKNKVMAIEGEKEEVDKVYEEVIKFELVHGDIRI